MTPFGLPARVESQVQRYVFLVSTFKRLQSALFAADCRTRHTIVRSYTHPQMAVRAVPLSESVITRLTRTTSGTATS